MVSVVSLALCVSVAVVNIFARYVFNHPFRWSEEFCVVTLIWMVYASLPLLEEDDEHLNMTAIYNFFPKKVKLIVNVLCSLTTAAVAALVAKASINVIVRNYALKINTQVFDWPYWVIYMAIPVAFIMIILTRLLNLKKIHLNDGNGSLSPLEEKEGEE
jgi:TRAP-type C4-dicarboxylate transport system permease small subunit